MAQLPIKNLDLQDLVPSRWHNSRFGASYFQFGVLTPCFCHNNCSSMHTHPHFLQANLASISSIDDVIPLSLLKISAHWSLRRAKPWLRTKIIQSIWSHIGASTTRSWGFLRISVQWLIDNIPLVHDHKISVSSLLESFLCKTLHSKE